MKIIGCGRRISSVTATAYCPGQAGLTSNCGSISLHCTVHQSLPEGRPIQPAQPTNPRYARRGVIANAPCPSRLLHSGLEACILVSAPVMSAYATLSHRAAPVVVKYYEPMSKSMDTCMKVLVLILYSNKGELIPWWENLNNSCRKTLTLTIVILLHSAL